MTLLASLTTLASADASGWKLAFEDTFDGVRLDRDKWATRFIYSDETTDRLNDELEHYRDNGNHVLRDGRLELVARRVGPNAFESGMIRSIQTFYYGYFEARVFLPKGRGIWPAFWLNSDYDRDGNLSWPPEIDIFEYAVNGLENTENMVHSAASTPAMGFIYMDPKFEPRWQNWVSEVPLNVDWHVFGLVWTPSQISVFMDGKQLYTQNFHWLRSDGTLGPPAHIILNFAVGGKWAGKHGIDEAYFPQSLKVDYVRVCQFTKEDAGTRSCGDSKFTPNPKTFGYEASFDDMEKPIFSSAVVEKVGLLGAKSVTPGSILTVQPKITFPPTTSKDRTLTLFLRNAGSNVDVPSTSRTMDDMQYGTYRLPDGLADGDYYLMAELLSREIGGTNKNRVPVRCSTELELAPKALSCEIARLNVRR